MKLVRHGELHDERPGLIDAEGRVRDLSAFVRDIDASALGPGFLAGLRRLAESDSLPVVADAERLGACVANPSKFVCIGLNYHAHINEIGATAPAEPVVFMKAPSALSGPFDDVLIPPGATAVDWEVELGVVIGTRASCIPPERALSHIAGYCIVNDISERTWQLEGTGQWVKGKSADTFGPTGPWLVTRDEIADPQRLSLSLSVNGESVQSGNTSDMVFDVRRLISYISRFMTLLPGDIVSTGTPPGVGMAHQPPRYLRPGDVMEVTIEGLGTQIQRAAARTA